MTKVTFLPDENSISDPKLVADLLDRIENCLDKGGSNTYLTGVRDSIKRGKSYTPNQMWRVQKIEDELDGPENNDIFRDFSYYDNPTGGGE